MISQTSNHLIIVSSIDTLNLYVCKRWRHDALPAHFLISLMPVLYLGGLVWYRILSRPFQISLLRSWMFGPVWTSRLVWTKTFVSVYRQSIHVDITLEVANWLVTAMFIRRILAPVLRVLLSILTLSVKSALLTVATDAYVLNKVSLVNAVKKV